MFFKKQRVFSKTKQAWGEVISSDSEFTKVGFYSSDCIDRKKHNRFTSSQHSAEDLFSIEQELLTMDGLLHLQFDVYREFNKEGETLL